MEAVTLNGPWCGLSGRVPPPSGRAPPPRVFFSLAFQAPCWKTTDKKLRHAIFFLLGYTKGQTRLVAGREVLGTRPRELSPGRPDTSSGIWAVAAAFIPRERRSHAPTIAFIGLVASQQPMGQCSCFVLLSQQPMVQCSCLVLLLRHNQ